jgi:hypothetical protein
MISNIKTGYEEAPSQSILIGSGNIEATSLGENVETSNQNGPSFDYQMGSSNIEALRLNN